MSQQTTSGPPATDDQPRTPRGGSRTVLPLLIRIVFLGLVVGVAFALTPALATGENWPYLLGIWVITVVLVATYATGRAIPLKYLVPGTLLLAVFVVYPIGKTMQTSFTNYGDGTRTSKSESVAQIVGSSVRQTPDAPRYNLAVGTTGSVTSGPFTFLLVDPANPETALAGTAEGLETLDPGSVTIEGGFVRAADGYEILDPQQVNDAGSALADLTVPTDGGAIQIRKSVV